MSETACPKCGRSTFEVFLDESIEVTVTVQPDGSYGFEPTSLSSAGTDTMKAVVCADCREILPLDHAAAKMILDYRRSARGQSS